MEFINVWYISLSTLFGLLMTYFPFRSWLFHTPCRLKFVDHLLRLVKFFLLRFSSFLFWHQDRLLLVTRSFLRVIFEVYFCLEFFWFCVFTFSFMDRSCHVWVFKFFTVFFNVLSFFMRHLFDSKQIMTIRLDRMITWTPFCIVE